MNAVKRRYEKKEKIATDAKRPPPKAPRFIEEQRRIKRRNAALQGLWYEATKTQNGSSQENKIRDSGGKEEAEAIEATNDLFAAMFESGSVLARMKAKREMEEARRKKAIDKIYRDARRAEAMAYKTAPEKTQDVVSKSRPKDAIAAALRAGLIDERGKWESKDQEPFETGEKVAAAREAEVSTERSNSAEAIHTPFEKSSKDGMPTRDETNERATETNAQTTPGKSGKVDQEVKPKTSQAEVNEAAKRAAERIAAQKAAIKKQIKFNQMKQKGKQR